MLGTFCGTASRVSQVLMLQRTIGLEETVTQLLRAKGRLGYIQEHGVCVRVYTLGVLSRIESRS